MTPLTRRSRGGAGSSASIGWTQLELRFPIEAVSGDEIMKLLCAVKDPPDRTSGSGTSVDFA